MSSRMISAWGRDGLNRGHQLDRTHLPADNAAMVHFFNTSGPCRPDDHYMLSPLARLPTLPELIDRKSYFVLHAPRQSGKSTALLTLAQELTKEGCYASVLLSVETGDPFPDEIGAAEDVILDGWRLKTEHWLPTDLRPPPWPQAPSGRRIVAALAAWARASPRPLVVFLDEIDALQDGTLRSVLRQLRDGFADRPGGFPWSLGLCGMRDVRDYKIASGGSDRLNTASPFNIKVASLTLQNFTRAEVAALYGQHTAETGQIFEPASMDVAYAMSGGQPWLVNALAAQIVDELVRDRSQQVRAEHVLQAKEILIQRRDTHLDSLAERLREPRVRRVIEPILVGEEPPMDVLNDDLLYTRDLGLIVDRPQVRIANDIYQELIPRALTYVMQSFLAQEAAWYLRPSGGLDMVLLLAAFQEFFAEHSEAWLGRFDYQEAGPHLLLMAFLQRILNGGGRIRREFAVGSGRADLVVEFGGQRSVLELKLRRNEGTVREGVAQLCGYLDRLGEAEGHLVVFDRRKTLSWADKISIEEVAGPGGQRVYVFEM